MCTCLYISYTLKNNNFLFLFLKTLVNVGFQDICKTCLWVQSGHMVFLKFVLKYALFASGDGVHKSIISNKSKFIFFTFFWICFVSTCQIDWSSITYVIVATLAKVQAKKLEWFSFLINCLFLRAFFINLQSNTQVLN